MLVKGASDVIERDQKKSSMGTCYVSVTLCGFSVLDLILVFWNLSKHH